MEKEILNEIPEYVKKLPPEIQDLVFNGVWEQRTREVANKYSLSEPQTEDLLDLTVLTLIGLERPQNFIVTLVSNLNISRLLAEQIVLDLDKRVFEYAIKTIESKINEEQEISSEKTLSSEVSDILKVSKEKPRSENRDSNGLNHLRSMSGDMRSFEKEEVEPKQEAKTWLEEMKVNDSSKQPESSNNEQKAGYAPANLPGVDVGQSPVKTEERQIQKPKTQEEFIQRPISVPRYTANLSEKDEGEYLLKKSGIFPEHQDAEHRPVGLKPDMSYQKQSPKDFPETKQELKTENQEIPKKYSADPYREPIE